MLRQLTLFLKVRFLSCLILFKSFWIILHNLGQKHSVKFALQLDNHPLRKNNVCKSFQDLGVTNVKVLTKEHQDPLDYFYLIHAWYCKDFNCTSEGCFKMKQMILHSYECKIGGCQICKKTLILCYYHVWVCENNRNCNLPFCSTIWQKMGLQLKFQEAIKDLVGCQKI